jgi:hypothetical protein
MSITTGSTVEFIGYEGGEPEEGVVLTIGQSLEVVKEEKDDQGTYFVCQVDNPAFKAKKKPSSTNPQYVDVEVFDTEVKAAEEAETKKAPAKAKKESPAAKKKRVAAEEAEAEEAKAEEAEAEAEEEGDEDESVEIPLSGILTGMIVDVVDDNDATVVSGEVVAVTKTGIKIGRKSFASKTFAFFTPEVEAAEEPQVKAKAEPKAKDKAKAKTTPTSEGTKEIAEVTEYVSDWDRLKTEDEEMAALISESDDLVETAKEFVEEAGNIDYRLGGVLYHLALTGDFQKLDDSYVGKGGFESFVNTELGFGYRKARYLIDIYVQFNKYGIDGSKVADIGWTKACKIAEVAKMAEGNEDMKFLKKDANALIKAAKNGSVKELEEKIKVEYKKNGDGVSGTTTKFVQIPKCKLPADRAEVVVDILEQAMDSMGKDSMDVTIETIILEWAQENLDT